MVRMLGVHQTNEVKVTQNLAIIVLFFMICWIPLYTINCILAFRPDFHVNSTFMLCCIILSHLNSAGNPILYAYHLKDFRAALKNFFCSLLGKKELCEDLNRTNFSQYRYQTRKKSSMASLYNYNVSGRVNHFKKNNISTISKYPELAGEADETRTNVMWNISEHSSGSSDSNKSNDHDKTLMIRPPTPFRQICTKNVNSAYIHPTCDVEDEEEDEDTLPYHEYLPDDPHFSDDLISQNLCSSDRSRSLSNSSPHLSRIFIIENEKKKTKSQTKSEPNELSSTSFSEGYNNLNYETEESSLKHFNKLRHDKKLSRSYSDSRNVCVKYTSTSGILPCTS